MSGWKCFIIAGILILSTSSLSAMSITKCVFSGCDRSTPECCVPCDVFTGFYIGIAGGIATNMAAVSMFSSVLTKPQVSENYLFENHLYQLRPWGEVHGGWGIQLCWLYLGLRIAANFSKFDVHGNFEAEIVDSVASPPEFDLQNNTIKTELRTAEFTFDFKPGIIFCNNTMFFGLFGAAVNRQHMHARARYSFFTVSVSDAEADVLEGSRARSSAGFRGGAGIEHMFCNCLSFNLNYVYTRYWEFKEDIISDSLITGGYNGKFTSRASKQVTSVGLSYYF